MDAQTINRAIDSGYILAGVVAIGFLLAYIAGQLSKKNSPR